MLDLSIIDTALLGGVLVSVRKLTPKFEKLISKIDCLLEKLNNFGDTI